jgi:FtsP/CotA-like multicopper oxidase with cupredoxin domain
MAGQKLWLRNAEKKVAVCSGMCKRAAIVQNFSRRKFLFGGSVTAASMAAAHSLIPHSHGGATAVAQTHSAGATYGAGANGNGNKSLLHVGSRHLGMVGKVDPKVNGFDPQEVARDFYRGESHRNAAGQTVREYELVAEDKEIEVAPGVKYAAWTYNGRVPGPTIRATEGELLRIRFVNKGEHPHTIHFHGIHTAAMDGVPGLGVSNVAPGASTVYEFRAEPFGLHLYHCHSSPLADHITKGLYGAFIIDPKEPREAADEIVFVQNGFDVNFDRANEVYAVNSVAFAYLNDPIKVKRDSLVRIYLVNLLEFDLLNSFHLHGNFFKRFPVGTMREPTEFTDTVMQGQGQRDILELRFPYTGSYMFHAHVSEFAELGWMGFFEVTD